MLVEDKGKGAQSTSPQSLYGVCSAG